MIIFHAYSWQQFLVAAAVLTLTWYVMVGLLFYRREIAGLFSGKAQLLRPAKVAAGTVGIPEEEVSESLLGRSREPEGVLTLAMDQFSFAGAGRVGLSRDEPDLRVTQLGLVPDLMEELKTIFYILERDGGTREDFEELFQPVAARFESVMLSPSYAAVNAYILEQVPFELSEEELLAMWQA